MDTIFIKGLEFMGRHGVYDEEHTKDQRFGIDIEINQEPHDWQEKIKNTYDYMDARDIARHFVEEKSFKLIETLGEAIATEILKNPHAKEVKVTVKKLDVVLPAEAGVFIHRKR
jgi:dihydroneopterin aldolase